MPNFTPPETDEEMPELPEAPTAQPTAPPATDLVPFTGHLTVLNPLLEEITAYRASAGMGPQSLIFTPGTKPSVKREMMQERKMRGTRLRSDITAIAKQTREDALRFQRDVIAAEKKLVKEVEEVEGLWAEAISTIDREEQEEKNRRQAEIDARVRDRMASMTAVNAQPDHPGMAVWHGESLATMAQDVFAAHLSVATQAFNEAERIRLAEAAELERLRAAEATRVAEQAEKDRLAREAEASRLEAQRVAQDAEAARLDGIRLENGRVAAEARAEQERVAAANRLEAERLARQAQEARASLRSARQAELDSVKGSVPRDDTGHPIDIANIQQDEWVLWVTEQRTEFATAEANKKLDSERAAVWAATPGHALVEHQIEDMWFEMSAEEFQSWVNMAGTAEKERLEAIANENAAAEAAAASARAAEAARLEALRPDKEKIAAYAQAIQAVPVPELATDEGRKALEILRRGLEATLAALV